MGLRVDQRLEIDDNLYDNLRRGTGPANGLRTRLRSRRVAPTANNDDDENGPTPW